MMDPILYKGHRFERLLSWHCSVHGHVCDPFTPVTADDILALAAKDATLDDGAFVALSRAVRGAR